MNYFEWSDDEIRNRLDNLVLYGKKEEKEVPPKSFFADNVDYAAMFKPFAGSCATTISKVIISNTTVTIIWNDGYKTQSRPSSKDTFDPEVGVAMCIAKKVLGSRTKLKDITDEAVERALAGDLRKKKRAERKEERRREAQD